MTEKDERSIVSGEPRYGKQDPTWLDHLGDRKPAAVEHAAAPDDTRVVHIVGYWQGLLERLRIKVPRTLCGASLTAPGPELGPDAPMCPECEHIEADLPIGIAPEDPELIHTRVLFLLNWFGGCALVGATFGLSLLHPPVWLAAIFAAGIAYGLLRFSEGLVAAHNRAWDWVHDGEA